jgi:ADP-ribosylglycohydrolase
MRCVFCVFHLGLSSVIGQACGSRKRQIEAGLVQVGRDYRLTSSTGIGLGHLKQPKVQAALGCFFGQALGDAFGLSTEFLTAKEVAKLYGDDDIPFPEFKRNAHNSRWVRGDWSDDTDALLLVMEAIVEDVEQDAQHAANDAAKTSVYRGNDPTLEQRFAKKLHTWVYHGFAELGDKGGAGLGSTTARVVSHEAFLKDPQAAARAVWEASGKSFKPNGGIMRTAMIGVVGMLDEDVAGAEARVIEYTRRICTTTHTDPLCVASCLMATLLVARLVRCEPEACKSPEEIEALIQAVLARVLELMPELPDADRADFLHHCRIVRDIKELKLDEADKIGYTLKCLAAGLWGLRSRGSFCDMLQQVAKEGGDSDTNLAIAGALLGCRMGFKALPEGWLQAMPHRAWAEVRVGRFLKVAA